MRRVVALDVLLALGLLYGSAGCAEPERVDGDPIQIVAVNAFTGAGAAEYGVLEIRGGDCSGGEDEPVLYRRWFAAARMGGMGGMAAASPAFTEDEVCVRVFAVVDEVNEPPLGCTIIGEGATPANPGADPEDTVTVTVGGLAATRDGPGLSPRRDITLRYGPGVCPPRPVAPYEAERIGGGVGPTFRFAATAEANAYCLRVAAAGAGPGEGTLRELAPPAGELATLALDRGELPPSESDVYEWSVRACPDGCPALDDDERAGGGDACTSFSTRRRFVARPQGDLNGDVHEDLAFGMNGGTVHMFLSNETGAPEDTFDICGVPYRRRRIEVPDGVGCGPAEGPIPMLTPFFGIGLGLGDVGLEDERAELLVGSLNCQGTFDGRPAEGGALFVYDADGTLRARRYFEQRDTSGLMEFYGFDVELAFRGGVAATDVVTMGGKLTNPFFFQVASAPLLSNAALGDDARRDVGGFVVGRGDLDGDGLADLLYPGSVWRAARVDPSGAGEPFDEGATRFLSGTRGTTIVGDTNGNGRAEVLIPTRQVGCLVDLQVSEFDDELALVRVDGGAIPPRSLPELAPGVCPSPIFNESVMATALPHGTPWGGLAGPLVAYVDRLGLTLRQIERPHDAVIVDRPGASTACLGVLIRGTYDLNADGLDELIVVDPAENRVYVACSDQTEPPFTLTPIVDRASPAAPFAPYPDPIMTPEAMCVEAWSLAP